MGHVGIFFYTAGQFLFHGCDLSGAEIYGGFKVYSRSHFEVWDDYYFKNYHVDYDYYPRGRIVYDTKTNKYLVYRDACIPEDEMQKIAETYVGKEYVLLEDEHYQCHRCNPDYVDLSEIVKDALLEESKNDLCNV